MSIIQWKQYSVWSDSPVKCQHFPNAKVTKYRMSSISLWLCLLSCENDLTKWEMSSFICFKHFLYNIYILLQHLESLLTNYIRYPSRNPPQPPGSGPLSNASGYDDFLQQVWTTLLLLWSWKTVVINIKRNWLCTTKAMCCFDAVALYMIPFSCID